MTKAELDRLSAQNKGVYNKIYYDEFGNSYIGTFKGKIVRNVTSTTQTVTTTVPTTTTTTTTPSLALDDLTDVTLTSPAPGEALVYNGTDWVNQPAAGTGTVTSIATTSPITGGTITTSGTIGINQSGTSTDGYLSSTDWNTFDGKQDALTFHDLRTNGTVLTITDGTGAVVGSADTFIDIPQADSLTSGYLDNNDFNTFANKQDSITLTTTGSSGAATFVGNTLNVPNYSLSGISSLNGLTGTTQTFSTGTSGTDFNISSSSTAHTFNIPNASASNRGVLTSIDYNYFSGKQDPITLTTTGSSGPATLVGSTLNVPQYASASALISRSFVIAMATAL